MPNQTAVFVNALVAHFGDRAYPFALEQIGRAAGAGMHETASSWAKIADGIAVLSRTASSAATVLIDGEDSYLAAADGITLRQLLYVSIASRPHDEDALDGVLRSSRDNNVLYGVTGILWSDGERFIQALEGPFASVEETYARILVDERHHSLAIIYDHVVEKREFGSWLMCHRRSYETDDEYDEKVRRALSVAPSPVRATILSFVGGEISRAPVAAS